MRRYLPFLLLLFVIAALLRVDFFFTIAYLFFLLYVLARAWTRRGVRETEFKRRFTPRAFAGDEVDVEVRVRNRGRLPVPWLQVHESLPVELITPPFHQEVFSLAGGESRYFRYRLYCRRRGVYRLGPLRAQTGDVLGILPTQPIETPAEHLVVYPQVVPLASLGLPTHSPLVALPARAPLFEDPARVTGVRDYLHGDSPRRIHWTASATSGRLLVKQYQPAIARETLLCLDLTNAAYDLRERTEASELAIVVAASLAHHILVRERLPVGLATDAADPLVDERASQRFFLPPRSERGHLMNVLETLARAHLANGFGLAAVLRRERPHLAWGSTVVAITGHESEELMAGLAALRQAGFAVALVLVQRGAASARARQHAAVLGIPLHHVWRERDLEAWR